jgi:hypothetical protein
MNVEYSSTAGFGGGGINKSILLYAFVMSSMLRTVEASPGAVSLSFSNSSAMSVND